MTFIWALQARCTKGQEQMLSRAKWAMAAIVQDNMRLVVPTPCLAELLVGIEKVNVPTFLERVHEVALVVPFDARAATLAAEIHRKHFSGRVRGSDQTRQSVKTDIQIIATCAVHRVARFYTHDRQALAWAKQAGIDARDLPTLPATLREAADAETLASNADSLKDSRTDELFN